MVENYFIISMLLYLPSKSFSLIVLLKVLHVPFECVGGGVHSVHFYEPSYL